ncbi:DMT family transporter [Micromonospora echinofusca]|uniref:EamA family transporter n=1 Tax=Micromonospora echinofusca TaxID=47858 RepID=A0ABS3VWY2_MICEH|nr:DMT family transporter [Micromonospora echinofusca]MBO4208933.1 EamA family transporter [Micromonospora echinofusca]
MPPPQLRLPLDPLTSTAVVLAVAAVSSSAPLIAFAAAPALAIAFWRNALAVAVLGPYSLVGRRHEFAALRYDAGRRQAGYSVLAGVALAVHFATWMPSAQLTSVATAAGLVATQPVWQGLIALGQGRRPPPVVWAGIGLAVLGALVATGADFRSDPRAFLGDLLALAGAAAAAGYTALGERARTSLSTTTYTTICYGVCALLLLLVCLVGGVPLTGFDGTTWLAILGLVVGAQLLGHSMFNYVLHRMSATTVSVLTLLEAPGAALIAWLWLDQAPRPWALPGLGLLLVGVAVVLIGGARAGRRTAAVAVPPEAGPLPDRTG